MRTHLNSSYFLNLSYVFRSLFSVIFLMVFLNACSGSGNDKNDTDTAPANTTSGVFVDSAVANIRYRTATQSGLTDANGRYNYLPGETVIFSIGGISLPPVTAKGILTPLDIAQELNAAATINTPLVSNIARLLQSLDSDNNPENGITISDSSLQTAATLDVTSSTSDFETAFATVFPSAILISEAAALQHLQNQLNALNAQFCPANQSATIVSVLPSAFTARPINIIVDAVLSSSPATSSIVVGQTATLSFSGTSMLIDGSLIADAAYQCSGSMSEFRWVNNDTVYAASISAGEFNELNLLSTSEVFLLQYIKNTTVIPSSFGVAGTVINDGSVTGVWELSVNGSPVSTGDISVTGATTFATNLIDSANYSISVPANCSINNGSGIITMANVSNVEITCNTTVIQTRYVLSGAINNTNAIAGQWELKVDGVFANDGSLNNASAIIFSAPDVLENVNYTLTLSGAAASACSLQNASGMVTQTIDNIIIDCDTPPTTYDISGTISNDGSVTGLWEIQVNGGFTNDGAIASVGATTFTTNVSHGSTYTFVLPSNCSILNGTGTINNASINNVSISCSTTAIANPLNTKLFPDPSAGFTASYAASLPSYSPVTATDPSAELSTIIVGARNSLMQRVTARALTRSQSNLQQGEYTLSEFELVNAEEQLARIFNIQYGPDQDAQTSDDIIIGYQYQQQFEDFSTNALVFNNPGADEEWLTEDDMMGEVANSGFFQQVNIREQVGNYQFIFTPSNYKAGNDSLPLTSDDSFHSFSTPAYTIIYVDDVNFTGQTTSYSGAGSDGIWFTADDEVFQYSTSRSNIHGESFQTTTYLSSGIDGEWFTADDEVSLYTLGTLNTENVLENLVTFNGNGSDGIWFNADDDIFTASYYEYDASGKQVIAVTSNNAGTDGIWLNVDDTANALVTQYDNMDRVIYSGTHTAIGADENWFTADDTLANYQYNAFTDDGRVKFRRLVSSPGADLLWLTEDDLANYFIETQFDAMGRKQFEIFRSGSSINNLVVYQYTANGSVLQASVNNAGTDGVFLTADDIGSARLATETGYELLSGPGADATWFTADDAISEYEVSEFDSTTMIFTARKYIGAGADGVFKTADDIIGGLTTYQNIPPETLTKVFSAGLDGIFETADDVITYVNTNTFDGDRLIQSESSFINAAGPDGILDTSDDEIGLRTTYAYDAEGRQIFLGSEVFFGLVRNEYTQTIYEVDGSIESSISYSDGPDATFLTADDVIKYGTINNNSYSPIDIVVNNIGFKPLACNATSSETGDITVTVADNEGNLLENAIVRLNSDGTEMTTGADGIANFTNVTGQQNIHVFKEAYHWESFYCIEPGITELNSKIIANNSAQNVSSYLRLSGNPSFALGGKVIIVFIDDTTGKIIGSNTAPNSQDTIVNSLSSTNFLSNLITMPGIAANSSVTGSIWAVRYGSGFKFDKVILEVQNMAVSTSYTTKEISDFDNQISLSATYTGAIASDLSDVISPVSLDRGSLLRFENGLTTAVFNDFGSGRGNELKQPDGMLPNNVVLADIYEKTNNGLIITAISNPIGGSLNARESVIALKSNLQEIDSGTISWSSFTQNKQAPWIVDAEITVSDFNNFVWKAHLPAGERNVDLPIPPATITDTLNTISNPKIVLNFDSHEGNSYQDSVTDLGNGTPIGADYERSTAIGSSNF